MINQFKIHQTANVLGLFLVCAALILVFFDQIAAHDLPCPLCLLQRACIIAAGIAFCMNIRSGIKTMHYGLLILAAFCGFLIAIWQVHLHSAYADPGYGRAFMGLHLYSWAAICFALILCAAAFGLFLERGFNQAIPSKSRWVDLLMILFILLILANIISTLLECGLSACPADPTDYQLLDSVG